MREFRRCAVCNKLYIACKANSKYCGAECQKYADRENSRACYQRKKESTTQKKKQTVTDIAVEARKAGMTYGQYVAQMEYGMAVEQKGE